MSFLSESQMIEFNNRTTLDEYSQRFIKSMKEQSSVSIFLSHSHNDATIVSGLIKYLSTFEIDVYVDWQDTSMPSTTNRETAQRIKEKIKELDLFWVLGTKKALLSKWVPWEIGVADVIKSEQIYIIPINDYNGLFYGNEYLQLYKRLEIATDNNLASFMPLENQGDGLASVLRTKGKIYG